MPLNYRLPLAFFFIVFLLVFSADATHGPSPAHARRSLAFKKKPHRQLDLPNILPDLGAALFGGSTTTSTTTSTSTSDASSSSTTNPSSLSTTTNPPSTSTSATTNPPSSDTSSTSSSPSTSTSGPTNCPLGLDLLGNCILPTSSTGSSSSSSSPTTDTTTSTSSPTSSGSSSPPTSSSTPPPNNCPLGLDLLGNCILPTTSSGSSSSSSSPTTDTLTSTPSPTSSGSSSPSTSSSTPPNNCPLGLDPLGNCILPTTSSTPSTTSTGSSSAPLSPSLSPTTDTPTSTPSITNTGSSSAPPSSSSTPSNNCPLGLDLLGNCILPPTTSTPSTTDTGSSSPPQSSSTPPSNNCPLGLDHLGNCILPPTTSTPSTTDTGSSSPPQSSSTPPSNNCPLGLDHRGNCILPTSSPTVSSTPVTTVTTLPTTNAPSSPPTVPATSLPTSSIPPASSSGTPDCPLGMVVNGVCVPPSTTTNPGSSSSSAPTPTSSPPVNPCGPLEVLLGLCPSSSSPPSTSPLSSTPQISPSTNPPESSSQSATSLTSAPSQTSAPPHSVDHCGPVGIALGLCTTSTVSNSATISPSPSQSHDHCGPFEIALGLCPTSSGAVPSSGSFSSIPGTPSQPLPSISQSNSLTLSFTSGVTVGSGSVSSSTSGSGSGTSSSSPPVIAFPTGTNNNSSSTTSYSSTATSDTSFSAFTPPPQTQLSYITQTSLLGASVPSSLPATQSNPDAVATTLSFATSANSASTTAPILLPSNLPARIYPPTQVDPNSLSGFTLVSILFDQFLPWAFVAQSTQSQGQLFLWLPTIVQSALGISPQQVKTFALQVYVPATYSGPADVNLLLTTFLLYIPSDQVPVLANQIKVASSPFYTSLGDPYKSLALHVDPAFGINSVQDPNTVPGTTRPTTSSRNKSRTDAIIGVASALGGLALVVLGVLIYRSVKRNRDLRHHRLSEPNAPTVPYPDRTGRDFDQDSVGGQRRRSFYFAEDSLRGQQMGQQSAVPVAQPQGQQVMQPVSQVEYSYRTSPDGVRERRAPVVTGAISAPILTQSSLNW